MKTVVLGIGNLLLGDEGVGVHAVNALHHEGCPKEVEVVEAGTAILDALPVLEKANRVIVLDAMKAHGEPGTVYRVPLEDCHTSPCIASMHGFDLVRVLALTHRKDTSEVLVLVVKPASIDWSVELSPQVAKAIPVLLEAVRGELEIKRRV